MDEAEWLACPDPHAMMRWISGEAGVIPPGVQCSPGNVRSDCSPVPAAGRSGIC